MTTSYPKLEQSLSNLSKVGVGTTPFIEKLRFTSFKKIEDFAELRFEFPFTVLVGANGTSKSSVLHALYGAGRGRSPGYYWFETRVDSLSAGELKPSVAYFHYVKGELKEGFKIAYFRKGEPEYWEAGKRYKKYGFAETGRSELPKAPVLYLDFRTAIPAFDRCFYFFSPSAQKTRQRRASRTKKRNGGRNYSIQDYIRKRSSRVLAKLKAEDCDLPDDEVRAISFILGKNYNRIQFVEHNFYDGQEAHTVLFHCSDIKGGYSEAFAGAGESAACLLVHKLLGARHSTLVLLDEPETSLHPDAQSRLLQWLLHICYEKRLQVVVATHSPRFVLPLPEKSVRVLEENPIDGKVRFRHDLNADRAFRSIDQQHPSGSVYVEDRNAKIMLDSILKEELGSKQKDISVQIFSGGADRIYRLISALAATNTDAYVIFDGDQRKDVPRLSEIPQTESLADLDHRIQTLANNQKLMSGKERNLRIDYLRFFEERVGFLPDRTPESIVAIKKYAEQLLSSYGLSQHCEFWERFEQEKKGKVRIELLCSLLPNPETDVYGALLNFFLLDKNSSHKLALATLARKIIRQETMR